jgi:hypothetical protein
LYKAIHDAIGDYLSLSRLKEVAHNYDTNCNEAINNLIAWIAPKNKYYSGSMSLKTRISFVVGIQSLGFDGFFRELLKRLGVDITPGTNHWLMMHDKAREKKQELQRHWKKRRSVSVSIMMHFSGRQNKLKEILNEVLVTTEQLSKLLMHRSQRRRRGRSAAIQVGRQVGIQKNPVDVDPIRINV